MTIPEAKDKVISLALGEVGYHEGPNNYNKYAENMDRFYGWHVQNQPYCDIFVDWLFVTCFGYDLGSAMTYQYTGSGSAACSVSAAYYKQNDAWYTVPEEGDQVFFTVGNGINHTGIVVHVGDGAISTVEGNSSDSVVQRTYDVSAYNIAGFGRPRWSLAEKADEQLPPSPAPEPAPAPARETAVFTVELPEIRRGDSGQYVKDAQGLLEAHGCTVGWYGIDGDFGAGTEQAVRNFQTAYRLVVDGIIGPETWKALLEVRG